MVAPTVVDVIAAEIDTHMRRSILYLLSFLFILISVSSVNAADVTLQWDTNEDADYYVIYYGTTSGNYTQNSENIAAPAVEYTIKDLPDTTWYFSIKAFNSCGNSSDFSDEISAVTVSGSPQKPQRLIFGE